MGQKILLLQPSVGEWDDMRSAPALPLALIHAATLAAEEFEVEIFDRRLYNGNWEQELERRVTDDVILVGATAPNPEITRSPILNPCARL